MGKRISKRYQSLTGHLEKKLKGTKKAFEKDKAFIQQNSNSNETKTNEENNVSNTKANGNDISEERRDTPIPRRQS